MIDFPFTGCIVFCRFLIILADRFPLIIRVHMGAVFSCCSHREQLLNLDVLACLDPGLVSSIEQLRRQHRAEIEQSYEIREGGIFRGGLDRNRRRTGYGELYKQGLVYLGDFSLDKANGYGILIKGEEEYYRGEFLEGRYHGKGREFSQQHEFQGEYEHGQRRRGTLRTNQFQYHGEFRNNVFWGHGHLQCCDGSSYDGMFEGGKYHGRGFLTFQNGNKYEGGFSNGKYHGEGRFTWKDGISAQCHYQEGTRTARQFCQNHFLAKNVPILEKIASNGKEGKSREWFEFREIPRVVHGDGMLEL